MPKKDPPEEETVSSPFYVVQFFPPSGTVAELPSTVTVSLSDIPNRALLGALTHYNIRCGEEALAATAVDSLTGYSSVTVTLPVVSGLAPGAKCTFFVSSNLTDLSGNRLGGVRTVVYTIQ